MKTSKWSLVIILLFFTASAALLDAGDWNWRWYAFPAVANAPGNYGTYFRTDLSIVNPYDWKSITVNVYYYPTNTDNTHQTSSSKAIPAKGSILIPTVLGTLFNVEGSGAITVKTDDSSLFFASARTYTQTTNGTLGLMETGQPYISSYTDKEFISSLRNGSGFRTNVGVLAFTTKPVDFAIEVFDQAGNLKGSNTVILKPNGHTQIGVSTFAGDFDSGYAVWKPLLADPSLSWMSYATVIDNTSGDSVFISGVSERVPSTVPYIEGNYGFSYEDASCHHYGVSMGSGGPLSQKGETFTYTIDGYGTINGTLYHDGFNFTLTYMDGGFQTGCGGVQVSGSGTVVVAGVNVTLSGTFGAPLTSNRPASCTCLPPPGGATFSLSKY
jgi:hypothetical protein